MSPISVWTFLGGSWNCIEKLTIYMSCQACFFFTLGFANPFLHSVFLLELAPSWCIVCPRIFSLGASISFALVLLDFFLAHHLFLPFLFQFSPFHIPEHMDCYHHFFSVFPPFSFLLSHIPPDFYDFPKKLLLLFFPLFVFIPQKLFRSQLYSIY